MTSYSAPPTQNRASLVLYLSLVIYCLEQRRKNTLLGQPKSEVGEKVSGNKEAAVLGNSFDGSGARHSYMPFTEATKALKAHSQLNQG